MKPIRKKRRHPVYRSRAERLAAIAPAVLKTPDTLAEFVERGQRAQEAIDGPLNGPPTQFRRAPEG